MQVLDKSKPQTNPPQKKKKNVHSKATRNSPNTVKTNLTNTTDLPSSSEPRHYKSFFIDLPFFQKLRNFVGVKAVGVLAVPGLWRYQTLDAPFGLPLEGFSGVATKTNDQTTKQPTKQTNYLTN